MCNIVHDALFEASEILRIFGESQKVPSHHLEGYSKYMKKISEEERNANVVVKTPRINCW
jgi:hypothetical protein